MPAFSDRYVVAFSAVVCVVCSVAVATAADLLRERIETNERWDRRSAILGALGLPEDGHRVWGPEVDALWDARVRIVVVDAAGAPVPDKTVDDVQAEAQAAHDQGRAPALLAVYQRVDGDTVAATALPLAGSGLWGPISGFLALEPDGETVSGTTFFAPQETPGLGYEITADWFEQQWVGKRVFDGGEVAPIRVVKGKAAEKCPTDLDHCVDGVSGATLTSNGVDAMVASDLERYAPYLRTLHGSPR